MKPKKTNPPKRYAIKLTDRNGVIVSQAGLTWDQVLEKISDTRVIDACIRLIGSDPL